MDYRRLGNTGLRVSPLCVGTMGLGDPAWREWVLGAEKAKPVLERALDLGINFFDMADFYSLGESERIVGETLLGLTARERLVLASKVYYPMSDDPNDRGLSRKHILNSIDASLRRIGTDYLDIYFVHAFDPDTPIEETMRALGDIVRAGKVRYLGASTMYSWQFAIMNAAAREVGLPEFSVMQCQYSLLYREEEREMIPYCRHAAKGVMTFSPLARGMLSDADDLRSRTDGFISAFFGDDVDKVVLNRVRELARAREVPTSTIASAWVAQSPNVDVWITGAQDVAQLEHAHAAQSFRLSDSERAYLEELYRPRDMINDHNPIMRPRAAFADTEAAR
jgi:aryl-alcohol dehydrogenase-like predicted oxidoreductase